MLLTLKSFVKQIRPTQRWLNEKLAIDQHTMCQITKDETNTKKVRMFSSLLREIFATVIAPIPFNGI